MEKIFDAIKARMKRNTKDKKKDEEELACMEKIQTMLNEGVFVKDGVWTGKDIEVINDKHFLTAKPVVFLVNIGGV